MKKLLKNKAFLVSVAVFLLLLFSINYFYRIIQQPYWENQQQAIQTAYKQTEMTEADMAMPFIGDEKFMIVTGKDSQGRKLIVWIGAEEIHAKYRDEGMSKAEIKAKLLESEPQAELIRLMPGVLDETYVWEAFYKKELDEGTRHYYKYYRFIDGELLQTYRLALTE